MILLTANTNSTVILTLTELSTSTENTYTLKLINESSNVETTVALTDVSTNTDRYNQFVINVNLDAGRYTYKAFDSNNIECEKGICTVVSNTSNDDIAYTGMTDTTVYYEP